MKSLYHFYRKCTLDFMEKKYKDYKFKIVDYILNKMEGQSHEENEIYYRNALSQTLYKVLYSPPQDSDLNKLFSLSKPQ